MRLSLLRAAAERVGSPWASRSGLFRPGSAADRRAQKRKTPAQPISEKEWKVFRGDTMQVLSGKEAGRQSQVTQVDKERQTVLLDRLNLTYYYADGAKDGKVMVATERPLALKDVALVDPSDRLPTEVVWRYTEQGECVRVSVRTGRIIPKPVEQREDGIIPELWVDGPKDTSTKDALEKTYTPSLKTFQEEIMERMGIVETRRHRKSYWY